MDTENYKKHRITISSKPDNALKTPSESYLYSAGGEPAIGLEFGGRIEKGITDLLDEAIIPNRRTSGDVSESAKEKRTTLREGLYWKLVFQYCSTDGEMDGNVIKALKGSLGESLSDNLVEMGRGWRGALDMAEKLDFNTAYTEIKAQGTKSTRGILEKIQQSMQPQLAEHA